MMVGTSLKYIQLVSPMFTIVQIAIRPFNITRRHYEAYFCLYDGCESIKFKDKFCLALFVVPMYIGFGFMALYSILVMRDDNRSEWVS